jgi:hypothetical protein
MVIACLVVPIGFLMVGCGEEQQDDIQINASFNQVTGELIWYPPVDVEVNSYNIIVVGAVAVNNLGEPKLGVPPALLLTPDISNCSVTGRMVVVAVAHENFMVLVVDVGGQISDTWFDVGNKSEIEIQISVSMANRGNQPLVVEAAKLTINLTALRATSEWPI